MEQTQPYGAVCGPYWTEAFLIGGGPSLKGFPLELLRSRTTLAVNDAAKLLPWATALFSLDSPWQRQRHDLIANFAGERYLVPWNDDPQDLPGVCYLRPQHGPGLSENPAQVCLGGTSGYGALNVAFLKRARLIVLLGYDYSGTHHWFPQYPWASTSNNRYYPGWARNFDSTLVQLKKVGVRVINASAVSRVTAYPRMSTEELKRRLENGLDI